MWQKNHNVFIFPLLIDLVVINRKEKINSEINIFNYTIFRGSKMSKTQFFSIKTNQCGPICGNEIKKSDQPNNFWTWPYVLRVGFG